MKAVWLQRGSVDFDAAERFISAKIWGAGRRMPGDTILASSDRAGNALGAAIYQNYHPEHGVIEISAAAVSPRWLSRQILREMFDYPFEQLGCQAVVLRCDQGDKVMARIAQAFGFARYDIPRLRGRDAGEAIYVLADDVWRGNGF